MVTSADSRSFFDKLSPIGKYFFAFLFTLLAFLFHNSFQELADNARFIFFFPCVFISTWLLGGFPGFFSLVCSVIAAIGIGIIHHGYMEPTGSEIFRFGIFFSGSLLSIWIIQNGKKSQLLLLEKEKRHRFATESSLIGVWELDLKTRKVEGSIQHNIIFGYPEKTPPKDLDDIISEQIHPQDQELVRNTIERSLREGKLKVEFRILFSNGSVHWVRAMGECEHDSRGRPVKVYGTDFDITEQKQTEENLQEALFYRDEFLSIASHELKTPLTSLKLQAQLFIRGVKKGDNAIYSKEKIDRLVLETDRQVGRLVRLVDDMLDISRIRTGKLTITKEPVKFHELVREVVERITPQFVDHKKRSPVIDRLDECIIYCDRMRMEQVISNLLNNAFRYGEGNEVKVRLMTVQKKVIIEVEDKGIGIEEHDLKKIFSRFQRAIPASEISGLGLGLYIAKQIVEAHGGNIYVKSIYGEGSTFKIELPNQ